MLKRFDFTAVAVGVLLAVSMIAAVPADAGLIDRSFFKPIGGVTATTAQMEDFAVAGYFNFGVVFPLYTAGGFNVYGDGSYADLNNAEAEQNWDCFTGKIDIFAKEPTTKEVNFYGFFGGSIVHSEEWDEALGKGGLDGGFGVVFPVLGTKPLLELGINRTANLTTVTLTFGLLIGAEPQQ